MEKLRSLDLHYADVEARLGAPETYDDPAQVAKLNKEQRELEPVVSAYRAYQRRRQDLADAEALMLESAPIVPLYFYARVYRISPMVENWTSNLLDYHDYKGVRLNPEAEK